MDWKKVFLLDWKNFGIAVIVWITSVIVHNFWYGIFGFEEAVFFSIAVFLVPLYLIVSIIYTIFIKLAKK